MKRRQFIRTSVLGLGSLSLGLSCKESGRRAEKPNIILVVTDDQRWDTLGCAGNPIIQTPNMDWLARNGVRFENAFVTTPICAASRASIFTGTYERTHTYTFTKPPLSRTFMDISYPFLLRKAGYRTGFIGKFGIEVEKGVTDEMFDVKKWTSLPHFQIINGRQRHMTEVEGEYALDFLRSNPKGHPFCLSVSFWAPHADDDNPQQYFWPPACDGLYENSHFQVPEPSEPSFFEALPEFLKKSMNRTRWNWRFDTPEKYQTMLKGYYRMISGVDLVIGRIIQELNRLGMNKNTIIILISDNGYFLGERGFADKWLMYDPSVRVPLIICDLRASEKTCGIVRQEMVLNVDLAPTILELAGIRVPRMIEGQSLVPLLKGKKADWRTEIFCEHLWDNPEIPQSECIRTDRWKYIRYPQHPEFEELYDLLNDPHEKYNLAYSPNNRSELLELRKHCDQKIKSLLNAQEKLATS